MTDAGKPEKRAHELHPGEFFRDVDGGLCMHVGNFDKGGRVSVEASCFVKRVCGFFELYTQPKYYLVEVVDVREWE